jgi:hypothetical protein
MRDFDVAKLGLLDWKSQREEWIQHVKGYFVMRDKEEVYV